MPRPTKASPVPIGPDTANPMMKSKDPEEIFILISNRSRDVNAVDRSSTDVSRMFFLFGISEA